MKKIFLLFLITVLLILPEVAANAQQRTKSLPSIQRIQTARDSILRNSLQRAKITSSEESKLKAIGVDVRDFLSRNLRGENINDERCMAVMSNIVFIGKVISIVNTPRPEDYPFHSKVNVQIIELLKGPKQKSDTIQLLRQGGPITDYRPKRNSPPIPVPDSEKITVSTTTDANFKAGEISVFFASNIVNNPYLEPNYKTTISKAVQDNPKPSYFVMSNDKFEIKDSFIDFFGHKIPLEKIKKEIKQVAKILNQ